MNPTDTFLLGLIMMASLTAATFFLKFWKTTGDILFGAFAAFFFTDAAGRISLSLSARPNEGSPWVYIIRLIGLLLILAAILKKNYGSHS